MAELGLGQRRELLKDVEAAPASSASRGRRRVGGLGRASRPRRSLPLGPERQSGSCRVRSAAWQPGASAPGRRGGGLWHHEDDAWGKPPHCAGKGEPSGSSACSSSSMPLGCACSSFRPALGTPAKPFHALRLRFSCERVGRQPRMLGAVACTGP